MNRVFTILLLGLLFATAAPGLWAQSDVPILSGAVAFLGANTGGVPTYQPVIAPVLVAPFGDHWLVESRADIQGFFARQDGTTGPYSGQFFASLTISNWTTLPILISRSPSVVFLPPSIYTTSDFPRCGSLICKTRPSFSPSARALLLRATVAWCGEWP